MEKRKQYPEFIGFILIVVIVSYLIHSNKSYKPELIKTQKPPKTAEEIRKESIESQFSSWDGSHKKLTIFIKENMHNPKSFEHVRTTARGILFTSGPSIGAQIYSTLW